jgi:hypothetical protein
MDQVHSEGSHPAHETHHAATFSRVKGSRQRATSPIDPFRCCRRRRGNGSTRHRRSQGTPGVDEHSHAASTDDTFRFKYVHFDNDHNSDHNSGHDHGAFYGRGGFILPHAEYDDTYHVPTHHDHHVPTHHDDDPPRRAFGWNVTMSSSTAGS